MTETERAIAIIEARLPLYTDIGQINALRECISSIRSAALSEGQAQPGDVSLDERADALARRVWAYFHDGPVSAMWFDNNKDLGGPAHIRDLCRAALSVPLPEIEGGDKGDGWQPIETAPLDKTHVIIAVPTKDKDDFIVGEAYFDPEHYGDDGDWWWAGTNYGDYHSGPISEVNYHGPSLWQHLPAAPSSSSKEESGE